MKKPFTPLMLILAVSAGVSAHAQQGGVTILRGQSADQPAPATPDTGVRRVPTERNAAPRPATAPSPGAKGATLPLGNDGTAGGVLPASPPSDMAQAIASPKPLGAAEASALAAALKAVDEGRYADARAMVANFRNPLLTPHRRLEHPARGRQG
ncbi:MAG: hypothetical protein HYZ40_01730 [Rhodospirillales bacterium]|nr:hypothetical protein [Rhodospirillales bacterium]